MAKFKFNSDIKKVPTWELAKLLKDIPEGASRWYRFRYFKLEGKKVYSYSPHIGKWFVESKDINFCPFWHGAFTLKDLKREMERRLIQSTRPNP